MRETAGLSESDQNRDIKNKSGWPALLYIIPASDRLAGGPRQQGPLPGGLTKGLQNKDTLYIHRLQCTVVEYYQDVV
jgi:hypothetical protein